MKNRNADIAERERVKRTNADISVVKLENADISFSKKTMRAKYLRSYKPERTICILISAKRRRNPASHKAEKKNKKIIRDIRGYAEI